MLLFAQSSGGFVCHKVGTTNQAVTPKCLIILPLDAVVELAPHVWNAALLFLPDKQSFIKQLDRTHINIGA